MIKLIASDLDGTLLLNHTQVLPEGTCELIRRLKEKGILFVAASGRQYANLRRLFEPVQDDIAYICENGALVYYQGKKIHKEQMDWELGQTIIKAIMDHGDSEVLLSGEDTSYLQPKKKSYEDHMRYVVKNNVTIVDDILQTPEEYFKISVYEDCGIEKTQDYWKKRFGDQVDCVVSGSVWLDMMPFGVHKGKAMEILMDQLGIKPEESMAFGDNFNDLEMLDVCQASFAMDSAHKEIRDHCRYHADTVGHALELFLETGMPRSTGEIIKEEKEK